jgi:hypothetical protein
VQLALVIAAVACVTTLAWTVSVRTGLLTVSQFFAARPKPSSSLGVTLTPRGNALHQQLRVADLHCDALVWNRDLTRRSRWGDLDFQRMIEGNCAVVRIPTKPARHSNMKPATRTDLKPAMVPI